MCISLNHNATIDLNFAQSQYGDRFEFRFIKMRRYIDLNFASSKCDDTSIWISLHQNATIHRFGFRFIRMRRYINLDFASSKRHDRTSEIDYAINVGFVPLKWKWINKNLHPANRMPKEGCIENAFLLASIRVQQINVERIPGVDFFTKALPRTKYDQFHHYIVVNTDFSEEKRPKEWKL